MAFSSIVLATPFAFLTFLVRVADLIVLIVTIVRLKNSIMAYMVSALPSFV